LRYRGEGRFRWRETRSFLWLFEERSIDGGVVVVWWESPTLLSVELKEEAVV